MSFEPTQTNTVEVQLERARQRMLDRTTAVIIVLTLAATCWLISASDQGSEPGHRPWHPHSVLRAVTQLMAMNYEFPTRRSVEVKELAQGLGSAAAVTFAFVAWFAHARMRRRQFPVRSEAEAAAADETGGTEDASRKKRSHIVLAAQFCFVLFAAWSMLSSQWSPWPAASWGEGFRNLLLIAWAVSLSRVLSSKGTLTAAAGMVIVMTLTSVIGIWYFYERNPLQRLKFPIGNPIFFASCILPVMCVAASLVVSQMGDLVQATPPGERRQSSLRQPIVWGRLVALAVALITMLWAFELTDSRGPTLGLLAAMLTPFVLAAGSGSKIRRTAVVIVILLAILLASLWIRSQFGVTHQGRGASVRLRLYAWEYASDLIGEKPLIGHGQAAYPMKVQPMAAEDAEMDPLAFPGEVLAHAHNEWLEVLADLGLIGFAMLAVGLVLTILAALRTWNSRTGITGWISLGLLAGLIGMIVAETTSVGLRKPGLPIVFFTVISLIWAQAKETGPKTSNSPTGILRSTPLQYLLLVAGLVFGGSIAWFSWQDWQGARAAQRAQAEFRRTQWENAFVYSAQAGRDRLLAENVVMAYFSQTRAAHAAARAHLNQFQQTLQRASNRQIKMDAARELLDEDLRWFRLHAERCLSSGNQLLSAMPAYPHVAGMMGETFVFKEQVQQLEKRIGARQETEQLMPAARALLASEVERDPQDLENVLQLLAVSPDVPVLKRLDWLRKPLRRGPYLPQQRTDSLSVDLLGEIESVLAQLSQEEGFEQAIDQLHARVRDTTNSEDSTEWEDSYTPETLRLVARCRKLTMRFDEAVALADQAAAISRAIEERFPYAISFALLDQARYQLFATPEDPQQAWQICQDVIRYWPDVREREQQLLPVRRSLAWYQLAGGDEDDAVATLKTVFPEITPAGVEQELMLGYLELARLFSVLPAERQPEQIHSWVSRAIELAPSQPSLRLLAARVARMHDDLDATQRQLEAAAEIALAQQNEQAAAVPVQRLFEWLPDTERIQASLKRLRKEYPDSQLLKDFEQSLRVSTQSSATTGPANP